MLRRTIDVNEAVILIASNFRDRPFAVTSRNDDKPINTLAARGLDRESGDESHNCSFDVHHPCASRSMASELRTTAHHADGAHPPPGGGPLQHPCLSTLNRDGLEVFISIEMVSRSS